MDADIDTSMMQEIQFDNDRPVSFSDSVFEQDCNPETCLLCTLATTTSEAVPSLKSWKKLMLGSLVKYQTKLFLI